MMECASHELLCLSGKGKDSNQAGTGQCVVTFWTQGQSGQLSLGKYMPSQGQ